MADQVNINVISNLKVIRTGSVPTATTLPVGHMAFGKITETGKYHIFGNSDGVIKDYVIDLVGGTDLQDILNNGNIADGKSIRLTADEGFDVIMSAIDGFTDDGKPVLSANSERTIEANDALVMRTALGVYSKDESDALLSTVFIFKGKVAEVTDLPDEDQKVGDAYQVEADGKIYAWTGDDWVSLAAIIDLSDYYTIEEIDGMFDDVKEKFDGIETDIDEKLGELETELKGEIEDLDTKVTNLDSEVTTAKGKITTLEGKVDTLEGKVSTLEGKVETLETTSTDHEERITDLETKIGSEIEDIGEELDKLDTKIDTLEANVYTKDKVYTKQEVDDLITGVENMIPTVTFIIDEI